MNNNTPKDPGVISGSQAADHAVEQYREKTDKAPKNPGFSSGFAAGEKARQEQKEKADKGRG